MQCLVFRLYGPMASWGTTAIGGVRPSASLPTRSAIMGLLAAALGIRRDEEDRLTALSSSIGIAVKAESEGSLLRDYHTAQVPSTEKKSIWPHRKAELEYSKTNINTVLSTRDYRADGHWLIALSENTGASVSLEDLDSALKNPVFPLFLGRKSCPLAAPLAPRLVDCNDMHEALSIESSPISFRDGADRALYHRTVSYQWDVERMGMKPDESWESWDQPVSRKRWQFVKKLVYSARAERRP